MHTLTQPPTPPLHTPSHTLPPPFPFPNTEADDTLVRVSNDKLPSSTVELNMSKIWEVVRANKDLNLPAHRVMVANIRCDEIVHDQLEALRAAAGWGALVEGVEGGVVAGFGGVLGGLLGGCLAGRWGSVFVGYCVPMITCVHTCAYYLPLTLVYCDVKSADHLNILLTHHTEHTHTYTHTCAPTTNPNTCTTHPPNHHPPTHIITTQPPQHMMKRRGTLMMVSVKAKENTCRNS